MTETSEISGMSPGSINREAEIAQIVTKVQFVLSLPVLSLEKTRIAVSAWAEILEPVPTHWLNRSYVSAMRGYDCAGFKPFGAPMILQAYKTFVANGTVSTTEMKQRAGALPDGPPCEFCENSGWMYVENISREPRKFNERRDGDRVARCSHTG